MWNNTVTCEDCIHSRYLDWDSPADIDTGGNENHWTYSPPVNLLICQSLEAIDDAIDKQRQVILIRPEGSINAVTEPKYSCKFWK